MRFKTWIISIIIYYLLLQHYCTSAKCTEGLECVESTVDIVYGTRIIGGYVCKKHPSNLNTKFIVALITYGGQHKCGGTLITSSWVLSAAHCYMSDEKLYAIDAASREYWVKSDGTLGWFTPAIEITNTFIHPEYDEEALFNDIAMFKLKYLMEENDNIKFVTLPKEVEGDICNVCDKGLALGWGTTKRDDIRISTSVKLMCVDLRILPNNGCFFQVEDSQLCTEGSIHRDSCYGDSGGPLMCAGVQYGITSWGINCAEGWPGYYTRVDHFLYFIENTIKTKAKSFKIFSNKLLMILLFAVIFI